MKLSLTFLLFFSVQLLTAQSFELSPVATPFPGVGSGQIAFADIDGDNDQDVFVTGSDDIFQTIGKLYVNDGNGNYVEVASSLPGVAGGSVTFLDVDNDDDQDVIITGQSVSFTNISKLFLNDGSGSFTESLTAPFEIVFSSSVAAEDIDGDGDQDVIIAGRNNSNVRIAKLYENNGAGSFTEVPGTPFAGISMGDIAFADVDGDNDQDVVITGQIASNAPSTTLYLNDGSGNFSEVENTVLAAILSSSVSFADVDGDNDQDLLISGQGDGNTRVIRLYQNDGSGNFTALSGTPFAGVRSGSINFADIDGDNDQDILITGQTLAFDRITRLYLNDGQGNFSTVNTAPFNGVYLSSVAITDIDADEDQDILIAGVDSDNNKVTKLYLNDGEGNFVERTGNPFVGVDMGAIAFADIDGDGDEDVLLMGRSGSSDGVAKLYRNDGMGSYTEIMNTMLSGVNSGSASFADVDGDDDQDLLITGTRNFVRMSNLYLNDGEGNFTLVSDAPLEKVLFSSAAFSDIDGDGDQDILITGQGDDFNRTAKLYRNDGTGIFTPVSGTPFDKVQYSSIAFADVDGDNDQDVLITGEKGTNNLVANLYLNNGAGSFSLATGSTFTGVQRGSVAFADVDGDSDQDLLITGLNSSSVPITELYLNDGAGNFSQAQDTPFTGVQLSSISFADVDLDDDQDVVITGLDDSGQPISTLYVNDSLGVFTEFTDIDFAAVYSSSIAFADVNGDDKKDLLITGRGELGSQIVSLYLNTTIISSLETLTGDQRLDFTIYPNPVTDGLLRISFASHTGPTTIEVYDLTGRLVLIRQLSIQAGQRNLKITTSSLNAGSYVLVVKNEGRVGGRKLMIR